MLGKNSEFLKLWNSADLEKESIDIIQYEHPAENLFLENKNLPWRVLLERYESVKKQFVCKENISEFDRIFTKNPDLNHFLIFIRKKTPKNRNI